MTLIYFPVVIRSSLASCPLDYRGMISIYIEENDAIIFNYLNTCYISFSVSFNKLFQISTSKY